MAPANVMPLVNASQHWSPNAELSQQDESHRAKFRGTTSHCEQLLLGEQIEPESSIAIHTLTSIDKEHVGRPVGELVGSILGSSLRLGTELGEILGIALGNKLGSKLGSKLGALEELGGELGSSLGEELGSKLGELDGD
jgi:hypothetical protein